MRDRTLTPQLFTIFSHLIEEACGVHYEAKDREIFATKLEAHAFDLGYDTLLDYYYRLRYDDPTGMELHQLVEAILVCETYFFRELDPLVQLVEGHLTDVIARRGRARVWSAACSTGEEPYTLAMLLDARGLLDKIEIVASDISAAAITLAATGRHRGRALRDGHHPELTRRYLSLDKHEVVVSPRIRESVRFHKINLLDDDAVRNLGLFDAIVVRNVLIYFRDDQIVKVVHRLARSLTKAGMLAVGVSESLLRFGTTLVCEERGGSFFYRRAG